MSDTYTKLFSSITESTVWGESYATRIVWVTMLAMADASGKVYGSIPGLARRGNVTLQEVETALSAFMSPDPYSRTRDDEGRRIEEIDGGWRLINHGKYSAVRNEEERRTYKREWDRAKRPSGHQRNAQSDSSPTQSDNGPTKPDSPTPPTPTPTPTLQAEKQKQERSSPSGSRLPANWGPSADDIAFAERERPDVDWWAEAEKFRDYWHGIPGAKGRKSDWPGTWRNWIRRADSKRQAPRAGPQQQQLGKTAQALMALEDFGNGGLDQAGNRRGAEAADVLGPGAHAGSGGYPADRRRLA